MRNALVMFQPFARFRESFFFFFRDRFVVNWGVRNRSRDRIKQAFEHADRRRHLTRGQSLDQFVGVLLVCSHA